MELIHDDDTAVLAALDRVLAAPDDRRLPDGVLDAARLLVAADSVVLTALGSEKSYWATSSALIEQSVIDAFERTADSFPLVPLTRTGGGATLRRSDVVADREFHELPAYREVLGPLGAEQLLATSFRLPDGRSACLVLNRARTDFSDRDVLRINALSARMSSLARFSSTLRPARPLSSVRRTLTPSEQRVLACVADGLTDRAAARRLGVAEATVRKHLEHSYRKLGVTNRVAATMSWLTGDGEPAQRAVATRLSRAGRHPQRVTEAGRGPSTHPGPALDPSPG